MTDHPSTQMLDQLLADTLAEGEARWVLAHLLGRCKPCLRAMRAALDRWRVWPALANLAEHSASETADETADGARTLEVAGDDGPRAYAGIARRGVAGGAAGAEAIRAQQLEVEKLSAILDATPRSRRQELIAADPRFHSWPLASRLLDAAGEFHWQEVGQGLEECRLALAIAERLPAARYAIWVSPGLAKPMFLASDPPNPRP